MLNSFLALLLCHLINDFLLQTDDFVAQKKSKGATRYIFLGAHSIFLLLLSVVILLFLTGISVQLLIGLIIYSLSHFIIDWGKIFIEDMFKDDTAKEDKLKRFAKKEKLSTNYNLTLRSWMRNTYTGVLTNRIYTFIADQVLHVLAILFLAQAVFGKSFSEYSRFLEQFPLMHFAYSQRIMLTLIILISITRLANILFKVLDLGKDCNDINQGRYIGSLERIIVALLVAAGRYEAIATMYVAKAAIRLGKTKESPKFAAYFIVGSCLSVLFGVAGGIMLKLVWYGY